MFDQLEAFFEQPTADTYRAARWQLLADDQFHADASELATLANALFDDRLNEATSLIDAMLPCWSLSAAFHDLCSRLALRMNDEDDAELERFMLSCCLDAILDTGDGSRMHPFLVTYVSDEYDVLSVLQRRSRRQRMIETAAGPYDVITCDDGSRIYFDVADLFRRAAEPVPAALLRRQRQAMRAILWR